MPRKKSVSNQEEPILAIETVREMEAAELMSLLEKQILKTSRGKRLLKLADTERAPDMVYQEFRILVDKIDPEKDSEQFIKCEDLLIKILSSLDGKDDRLKKGMFIRLLNRLNSKLVKKMFEGGVSDDDLFDEDLFRGHAESFSDEDLSSESFIAREAQAVVDKIRGVVKPEIDALALEKNESVSKNLDTIDCEKMIAGDRVTIITKDGKEYIIDCVDTDIFEESAHYQFNGNVLKIYKNDKFIQTSVIHKLDSRETKKAKRNVLTKGEVILMQIFDCRESQTKRGFETIIQGREILGRIWRTSSKIESIKFQESTGVIR